MKYCWSSIIQSLTTNRDCKLTTLAILLILETYKTLACIIGLCLALLDITAASRQGMPSAPFIQQSSSTPKPYLIEEICCTTTSSPCYNQVKKA
jgi:hypothetical protein